MTVNGFPSEGAIGSAIMGAAIGVLSIIVLLSIVVFCGILLSIMGLESCRIAPFAIEFRFAPTVLLIIVGFSMYSGAGPHVPSVHSCPGMPCSITIIELISESIPGIILSSIFGIFEPCIILRNGFFMIIEIEELLV